ncbi:MAG TPA: hypothetical protein ENN60_02670 [archaeon]|nr:hypothetical protein [archaeon]
MAGSYRKGDSVFVKEEGVEKLYTVVKVYELEPGIVDRDGSIIKLPGSRYELKIRNEKGERMISTDDVPVRKSAIKRVD